MSNEATSKLLAGALLAGAAVLTGDVTLLATASGIGVNWASEALPPLIVRQFAASSPLAQAGGRATRKALCELEKQFRKEINPNAERKSFKLLRDSAGAVLDPAYPPGAATLADLQQAIAATLEELLHGHDAQEVAFLRKNLLGAVALAFRTELDSDEAAWRAFHGRLIEQLHTRAAQPNPPADLTPLLEHLDDQRQALDALRDGDAALEQRLVALQELIERLEQGQSPASDETSFENRRLKVGGGLIQAGGSIGTGGSTSSGSGSPSPGRTPRKILFKNENVEVHGDALQAGENIYQNSAHAQGGSTAIVYNTSGSQGAGPAPSPPVAIPVLAIFAEPAQLDKTRWEDEARVLRDLLLPFEAQFALRELSNITPEELYQALLTVKPGILHFQGHGIADGLVFEDTQGDRYNVGWQALMDTLAACDSLACVILNACHSSVHNQVGPQRFHLITTPGQVSTESTSAFTQGFYIALRAGQSVPQAYLHARNLLRLKGVLQDQWPVLTEGHARER